MFRKLPLFAAVLLLGVGVARGADFYADCFQASNSTLFVSGFQRFARLKNDDNQVRTRYNPAAGAIGYVYRQAPWFAGASLSYEQGNRKYELAGGGSATIKSSMPGVTLFGGWANQDGWYGKGSTFIGYNSLKARDYYDGSGNSYRGNTEHSTQFGASVELGKSFAIGNEFALTPHVGFDYAYSPGETYNFGSVPGWGFQSQNFYELPIGVGLSKTFHYGNWAITPMVDFTLVNSLGGMGNTNTYPGFASRTADEWKVYGIGGDHLGGRIRTGVNARMSERTSMGLDYTYEGRSGYNDHRLSAVFGLSF